MLTMNLNFNPTSSSKPQTLSLSDGYCVSELMAEVRNFALMAFDQLNSDQNGFLSREELARFLEQEDLTSYQRGCAKFLLTNIRKISRNGDSEVDGISREEIADYFAGMAHFVATRNGFRARTVWAGKEEE